MSRTPRWRYEGNHYISLGIQLLYYSGEGMVVLSCHHDSALLHRHRRTGQRSSACVVWDIRPGLLLCAAPSARPPSLN